MGLESRHGATSYWLCRACWRLRSPDVIATPTGAARRRARAGPAGCSMKASPSSARSSSIAPPTSIARRSGSRRTWPKRTIGSASSLGLQGRMDLAARQLRARRRAEAGALRRAVPPRRDLLAAAAARGRPRLARGGRTLQPASCRDALLPWSGRARAGTAAGGHRVISKRRHAPPRPWPSPTRIWASPAASRESSTARCASLKRALELEPGRFDARNALGLTLMQRGDADGAVSTFTDLVARVSRRGDGAAEPRHGAHAARRPGGAVTMSCAR